MSDALTPSMTDIDEAQIASGGVTDVSLHSGGPVPQDSEFFAPAPLEIGEIQSAQSSLRQGMREMSPGRRAVTVIMWTAIGVGLGFGVDLIFSVEDSFWKLLWPSLFGLSAGGISFGVTRFSHTVTYAGQDGLASIQLKGHREAGPQVSWLRFADAQELHVRETRHYTNGVYQHTEYSYRWSNEAGNLFHIGGSYQNEDGPPIDDADAYHFATQGEILWSVHFLDRCLQEIQNGGKVGFNAGGKIWIEIGLAQFSLTQKGKKESWDISDLYGISIEQGFVTLTSEKFQSSGWFGRWFGGGKVQFAYANLANGRVFMLLFQHLLAGDDDDDDEDENEDGEASGA